MNTENNTQQIEHKKGSLGDTFSPLLFLASTGAGGISVGAFVIIQYLLYSGKGLAVIDSIPQNTLTLGLEAIMIIFAFLHIVLSIWFFKGYISWTKKEAFTAFKNNPLVHSALMAPVLSLAMSFNIVIATIRYFTPALSDNFQAMMLPAFIAYIALWAWTMFKSLSLLKISFSTSFDVDKIHFGWLLNPFALAMTTVTGTGFAALAKNTETISYNTDIAMASLFLTLISGSFALFLTLVKIFSIFKKHLKRDAVLENHFMPTYLIVIPIFTLFAISLFRVGHFAEGNWAHGGEIISIFTKASVLLIFAFQTWYFAFGLFMLKDYWKNYFVQKFHVSQWGLVCPFVAYAVLAGFVSKLFFSHVLFSSFIIALLLFTVILFLYIFKRQLACIFSSGEKSICDK